MQSSLILKEFATHKDIKKAQVKRKIVTFGITIVIAITATSFYPFNRANDNDVLVMARRIPVDKLPTPLYKIVWIFLSFTLHTGGMIIFTSDYLILDGYTFLKIQTIVLIEKLRSITRGFENCTYIYLNENESYQDVITERLMNCIKNDVVNKQ